MSDAHHIDPVIVEYVTTVENRFGAPGLQDMIGLAQARLVEALAALEELGEPGD
jgi:hypothetical protein